MKRREILLLGGAAAAWPLTAHAQQQPIPVIGFLAGGSPDAYSRITAAFLQGLKETGYVERQNVAIEYRWAEDHYDRLTGRDVRYRFVPGGQGGNGDDPDSVHDGRGPGKDRACK